VTILLVVPWPLAAAVSEEVSLVVMGFLVKVPDAGYENARALTTALRPFAAPALALSTNDLELASLESGSADDVLPPAPRSKRRFALAAIAAFAVGGAVYAARPTTTSRAPTAVIQPAVEQTAIEWSSTAHLVATPAVPIVVESAAVRREVARPIEQASPPAAPPTSQAVTTASEGHHADPLESPF
jgi:hypothetical protein